MFLITEQSEGKQIILHKGPFKYYVSMFWGDFLTHPLCVLLVSKNGQFLNPPTQSSAQVIYEWSLIKDTIRYLESHYIMCMYIFQIDNRHSNRNLLCMYLGNQIKVIVGYFFPFLLDLFLFLIHMSEFCHQNLVRLAYDFGIKFQKYKRKRQIHTIE